MPAISKRTALVLTLGLAACSGREEAMAIAAALPEPPPPSPPSEVSDAPVGPSVAAKLGGTLIDVSSFFVEVLLREGGELEALVLDSEGEPVTKGATLTISVDGSDAAVHPVAMAYDAELGAFAGELEGDLDIVAGPVEVAVAAGGVTGTRQLEHLAVAPAPTHGGAVLVAGPVAAEVVIEPEGTVHAYFVHASGAPRGAWTGKSKVVVLGVDGARHPCALRWNAASRHHVGCADGGVRVASGPVELIVERGRAAHVGGIERLAPLRDPSHGGQVAVAGAYTVEVVSDARDHLDAYVVDEAGLPITDRLLFTARVGAELRPVTMLWNAEAGCYRGELDPEVAVSAHPVEVALVGRGRRHLGGVLVDPSSSRRTRGLARHARGRRRSRPPENPK